MNCYDDGSGLCDDPGTLFVDPDTRLVETPGGAPIPGCGVDGCLAVEVPRVEEGPCWDHGAQIAGKVTYPGGVCSVVPLACTSDADCAGFTLGTCVVPPPVVEVFGEVPAGCIVNPRILAHEATNATASRVPGHVRFTWDVAELGVVAMHVIAVGRAGERRLNDLPIFPRANDGSLQAYEVRIPNRAIRGDRDFRIRVIAADGTERDTPITLE